MGGLSTTDNRTLLGQQAALGGADAAIDVVIPLWNGEKWIAKTLDSVFRQTLRPKRVIVVDDGYADGGAAVAARYPGVTLVRNTGKGTSAARNCGMQLTSSPFIIFFDCDDLWHPEHLRVLYDTLQAHPSCAYAVTWYKEFIDGGTPVFYADDRTVQEIDPWEMYPMYGFARTPGTTLFRREIIQAAGAWNALYTGMEDHFLWLRAAFSGPVAWCNARTLAYRRHPGSHLNRLWEQPEEYFALMLSVYDDLLQFILSSDASPERKALTQQRNALIHNIITAIISQRSGNRVLLSQALSRLNEGLHGEPWQYRKNMLRTLVQVLSISCAAQPKETFTLRFWDLFTMYPGGVRGPKKMLVYAMNSYRPGISFYLRHLLDNPQDLSRAHPLALTVASQLRQWFAGSRV